jgi:hypothetical protein
MRISEMRKALKIRHLLSVATLVFVFFLPLHFHLSPATPIAKECSCLHGTRTQLALAAEITLGVPLALVASLSIENESVWTRESSDLQKVRGPPTSTSL